MSAATVSYEHLAFPGVWGAQARELQRRLELAEGAARLFASGLLGMDVELSWTLRGPRPVEWTRAADGTLSVHMWLDLLSVRNRPAGSDGATMTAEDWLASFRTGLLHALGRVLYSPNPRTVGPARPRAGPGMRAQAGGGPTAGADGPGTDSASAMLRPLDWALQRQHPRWRLLPREVRTQLDQPAMRATLEGLFEELEDARVDGLLAEAFAGAPRQLSPRLSYLAARARLDDPIMALVASVALALAGSPGGQAEGGEAGLPSQLRVPAAWVRDARGIDGARRLAEFMVFDLLPLLVAREASLSSLAGDGMAPGSIEESEQAGPRAWSMRGLRAFSSRESSMDAYTRRGAPGTVVVELPRVDGGEEIFRIDRAFAHRLEPDAVGLKTLQLLREAYGPQAEEAFSAEAAPLRRALRVNWERRRSGRYRTGRHVGIPNLRRYVLVDDPRLFQRLEAPEALSYYFHVLVDVSYSMLENNNTSKALAAAYGFTDLLRSLKVPVDVTLYSAGVTELFDHRRESLERYFGGDFGYLLSGTLEMEAIAYAKQKAARVPERSKIFVVVTDGTPFTGSLDSLGTDDLDVYYGETFIPWLRRAGIELLAIGIDCEPTYHDRSVCLTESWDAVRVLTDTLEAIVEESRARVQELWA